jgi:hypothetical protein
VVVDARAGVGEASRELHREELIGGVFAGHAEDEVDVGDEAGGDSDGDGALDGVDVVAAAHGVEDAVRAGLAAEDDVVVVDVAGEEGHRVGRDVLGA